MWTELCGCSHAVQNTKQKRQLAQVCFLRQVEMLEWEATGAGFENLTRK
jgi:hypothetical protein